MAKFYGGQRVVLVRGFDGISKAKNYGQVGTYLGKKYIPKGTIFVDGSTEKFDCDCVVAWDRHDGMPSAQVEIQLEPLTPPHEACDPDFAESIRRLADSVSA